MFVRKSYSPNCDQAEKFCISLGSEVTFSGVEDSGVTKGAEGAAGKGMQNSPTKDII